MLGRRRSVTNANGQRLIEFLVRWQIAGSKRRESWEKAAFLYSLPASRYIRSFIKQHWPVHNQLKEQHKMTTSSSAGDDNVLYSLLTSCSETPLRTTPTSIMSPLLAMKESPLKSEAENSDTEVSFKQLSPKKRMLLKESIQIRHTDKLGE